MFQVKDKKHKQRAIKGIRAEVSAKGFQRSAESMSFDDIRIYYHSKETKSLSKKADAVLENRTTLQMQRWMEGSKGKSGHRQRLPLRNSEHNSVMPRRNGCRNNESVGISTAARLRRAIARRQVPGYRARKPSDMFAIIYAKTGADGKPWRTEILTPYALDGENNPYMIIGKNGPVICGENRPINKEGKRTTKYEDIAAILDEWCRGGEDRKEKIAGEMLDYLLRGNTERSELFQFPGDINVLRAARFMAAILIAAEPHRLRKNQDGGKLARACLRAIKNKRELDFTKVFVEDGNYFPQAQKGGNRKHVRVMKRDEFSSVIGDEMSDSTEEEAFP